MGRVGWGNLKWILAFLNFAPCHIVLVAASLDLSDICLQMGCLVMITTKKLIDYH